MTEPIIKIIPTADATQYSFEKPPPQLTDDFFYPSNAANWRTEAPLEMNPSNFDLSCSFGFDAAKRNNLFFLTESHIVTSMGNVLVIINVKTNESQYIRSFRDGSIGGIAVCGYLNQSVSF